MSLSLDGWKGVSMAVFTVISVIGAAIAVLMKENAKQLYVTCGVLFSAGVLLAGGLVHLLFDSNDQFSEILGAEESFPWAFSISGITIVGLACLEIVLGRLIENYMQSNNDKKAEAEGLSSVSSTVVEDQNNYTLHEDEDGDDRVHDHMHTYPGNPGNPFSAVLLTTALSLHSIIEGLGLGASGDVSEIQSAFFAIACHKMFTAFALAEGMVNSGYWVDRSQRKYFYISIGTFIFVGLLGIAIGWAISSSGGENILTAVLVSITSGSFIYVALLEILPQETKTIKKERLSVLPVLFFFLAGYCLMAMLALWV